MNWRLLETSKRRVRSYLSTFESSLLYRVLGFVSTTFLNRVEFILFFPPTSHDISLEHLSYLIWDVSLGRHLNPVYFLIVLDWDRISLCSTKLASNSWFSCFTLHRARNVGISHHTGLIFTSWNDRVWQIVPIAYYHCKIHTSIYMHAYIENIRHF